MAFWLYQMTASRYPTADYRADVVLGKTIRWGCRRIIPSRLILPATGDIIILFYSKAGTTQPGIYGWGFIEAYSKSKNEVSFWPLEKSDTMKMAPIWGADIEQLTDNIRGIVKQGTMWNIPISLASQILTKIKNYP